MDTFHAFQHVWGFFYIAFLLSDRSSVQRNGWWVSNGFVYVQPWLLLHSLVAPRNLAGIGASRPLGKWAGPLNLCGILRQRAWPWAIEPHSAPGEPGGCCTGQSNSSLYKHPVRHPGTEHQNKQMQTGLEHTGQHLTKVEKHHVGI